MPIITDTRTIKINGIEFTPLVGVNYKTDYVKLVDRIKDGRYTERDAYRSLILTDLWFIVYFVIGNKKANHPFVVGACKDIENGPDDMTLDIWAREHFKSTIITEAETIQFQLKNPDKCTCIFSHKASVAKKFLFEIKGILETSKILSHCFPDVVWKNCEKESSLWSMDEGLVLKRGVNRREPSIMAAGLVEGMPTGLHFDRLIFDDIVTQDMSNSFDIMEKVKVTFDMAQSIGTDGGKQRVVGTYYHYADPLVYIKEKKDILGKPLYHLRWKPATEGGDAAGKSVFLSEEYLNKMRCTKAFATQYLLDPAPQGIKKLSSSLMKFVDRAFIPEGLYKFMVVDPAGDDKNNKGKGDSWALAVIGVDPYKDDLGASNVYIIDMVISPFRTTEAIEEITRMYLRNGVILQVGVERVGAMTFDMHVSDALLKHGRRVSLEEKTLVQLSPAGRQKHERIDSALSWPFANGKIFMADDINHNYRSRLLDELDRFPYWHDDGLDVLSYVYDMIHDNKHWLLPIKKKPKALNSGVVSMGDYGWMGA